MKLRYKVPVIILICFGVLLVTLSRVFDLLVFKDYEVLEKEFIERNFQRIDSVIDVTGKALIKNAQGWSFWDETYSYVKGSNPKYKARNLNYEGVKAFEIDHIIFINNKGQIYDGYFVDNEKKTTLPLDQESKEKFSGSEYFTKTIGIGESRAGMITLAGKVFQFAVLPIQDNSGIVEPIGNFIVTSEINSTFTSALADQTKLKLNIIPANSEFKKNGELTAVYNTLSKDRSLKFLNQFDGETGKGNFSYSILYDYLNKPAALIQLSTTRAIYNQGLQTKKAVINTVLIIEAFTLLLIVFLLEKSLLSRLRSLSNQIKELAVSQNIKDEIKMGGKDELFFLAKDVNTMLHSLDTSRKELITAKEQAESANYTKTRFLATVSHELRTPIHGIFGLIRMCFKNETSSSKLSLLQMVHNTTQGLLETINDLLDISKNEVGKLTLDYKKFKVRDVVRDVLATIAPRAGEKPGVELICTVKPEVAEVIKCDPLRLKQIMMNLVGNAVKFTTKGVIHLEIGMETQTSAGSSNSTGNSNVGFGISNPAILLISCQDTGVGIPVEKLNGILKPYSPNQDSKTEKSLGTGLGLTVVNEVTESLGGKLSVNSKIGEGSDFIVAIPIEVVVEQKPFLETEKYITCITDNSVFIDHLNVGLKPLKLSIIPAQKTSLGSFRGAKILIDGKLLNDDNFWVKMRESIEFHNNKLIVILSPLQLIHKDRLELLKVHAVLIKPFLPEDLLALVKGMTQDGGINTVRNTETDLIATSKVEGLENLNILVADDIKTNQIILANLLEEAGHKVTVVDDGQELVDLLAKDNNFDIILTDIQMPRIDGLAATKIIRDREKADAATGNTAGNVRKRIPIVAVTAHAFPDEHQMMLDVGLSAIITKPIEPAKLRDLLKEIFKDRLLLSQQKKMGMLPGQNNNRDNSQVQINMLGNNPKLVAPHLRLKNWDNDSKGVFRSSSQSDLRELNNLVPNAQDNQDATPIQTAIQTAKEEQIGYSSSLIDSAPAIIESEPYLSATPEVKLIPVIPAQVSIMEPPSSLHTNISTNGPIIINNEALMLDKEGLLRRAGGKPAIAVAILESFIESWPELTGKLGSATDGKEIPEMRRVAHALKGILLDIGCQTVASLAEWLEKHPDGADWNTISAVSEAIVLKCDEVVVLVKKMKRGFESAVSSVDQENQNNKPSA